MNNDLAKPNQSQNKNQPLNQVQLKHLCKLDDFIKIVKNGSFEIVFHIFSIYISNTNIMKK